VKIGRYLLKKMARKIDFIGYIEYIEERFMPEE